MVALAHQNFLHVHINTNTLTSYECGCVATRHESIHQISVENSFVHITVLC